MQVEGGLVQPVVLVALRHLEFSFLERRPDSSEDLLIALAKRQGGLRCERFERAERVTGDLTERDPLVDHLAEK
ncbi:hypothetical protein [Caulobacter soli]|uniref:hypothetical protein n=1 Tax=Caulobacter soli TaxID=2708539 RepID=UPI0013ED48F7|nr:hypothetical protein [Caulobacter soli]